MIGTFFALQQVRLRFFLVGERAERSEWGSIDLSTTKNGSSKRDQKKKVHTLQTPALLSSGTFRGDFVSSIVNFEASKSCSAGTAFASTPDLVRWLMVSTLIVAV